MRRIISFLVLGLCIFFLIQISDKKYFNIFSNFIENIKIEEINIKNLNYLENEIILENLDSDLMNGFWGFNIKNLSEQILKIKEVESLKIYRNKKNIEITIFEKKPLALWKIKNKTFIIDQFGTILDYPLLNRDNLLVVKGENANKEIYDFYNSLNKFSLIISSLEELEFINNYRWNLLLKDNILIKLPFREIEPALNEVESLIISSEIKKTNGVLLDMRIENQIFIK